MDEREFMRGLYMLARTFVHGEIIYKKNLQAIDGKCRSRRARIAYHPDKNALEAFDLDRRRRRRATRIGKTMELTDPRAIPAVVRTFCSLLSQEMPSFYDIDEALKNEPPPEWHEEFEQATS